MEIDNNVKRQINSYYTYTKIKYYTHLQAAMYYKSWYNYTTTPLIIISSIVTVLASYNGSYNDRYMAISVAVISGIATIMQATIAFFEFDSKATTSLLVSNKYITLTRYIENTFYTDYIVNDKKISNDSMRALFNAIQTELTNIQSIEPTPPMHIENMDYSNHRYGIGKISDNLVNYDNPINRDNLVDCDNSINHGNLINHSNANREKVVRIIPSIL